MPQVIVGGPLEELELADEHGPHEDDYGLQQIHAAYEGRGPAPRCVNPIAPCTFNGPRAANQGSCPP
jgi:hypothetical protein